MPVQQGVSSIRYSILASVKSSTNAYDVGMSMHFLQAKHLFALFNCDFIYSQADFKTSLDNNIPNAGATNGLHQVEFKVTYRLLNFSMGIGYKF